MHEFGLLSNFNGQQGYAGEGVGGTDQWIYEYLDVIIAKINAKGEFEWITHAPLLINTVLTGSQHIFREYIAVATNNSIYILNNEHPKNNDVYANPNYDPNDLKAIHLDEAQGTNFICNAVSTKDGSIKHQVVFKNENYCFFPNKEDDKHFRAPNYINLFVPGKNNDIYIYTEQKKKERFSNIVFK